MLLNLIGVFVAFSFIIYFIRRKFNFGLSLIIGSIILSIFSLESTKIIDIIYKIISVSIYSLEINEFYTETIELAVLMTLIFVLAKTMQETKAIEKLINSLRTIFSKGGILGLIPAIYGLMPVPGGALFSAPMIDSEGEFYSINNNQKNFLNVWFRHIWFSIFPISSAMILICSTEFSNIDIYLLIFVNLPTFIFSIIIGNYYLKRFIKKKEISNTKTKKNYSGLIYLLPPIFPIIFYIFLQIIDFPQIRSFLIGIMFSIIILYLLLDINIINYLNIIKKSITLKMAIAIFGIIIFRSIFELTGASNNIANIIMSFPFPPVIIIIFIPIILGILTGYNLGAVALSYPLVEPFFQYTDINIIGLTSIIFISSLVGYLISPIHLCNVLSSEYLKTDTTRMYKMYIPSSFFILIVQLIFVIILFRF
jgi:integral membrane protein (TIGR00529 family)